METLGSRQIWTFVSGETEIQSGRSNRQICEDQGHHVSTYLDLACKIAALQFRNPDHILMFRGQDADFRTPSGRSTIRPTLFRPARGKKVGSLALVERRLERLQLAEVDLLKQLTARKLGERGAVRKHRLLRWALLQHYEVCFTPLLDASQSLRVAASFASLGGRNEAFLFVVATPHLGGGVTVSSETGVQAVRLSSFCPPQAVRPHIQEGFLLGEYPDAAGWFDKDIIPLHETDFSRRLLCKFRFNPTSFWQLDPQADSAARQALFPIINREALYPDDQDEFFELAQDIRTYLDSKLGPEE